MIEGVDGLVTLEELYLDHNGITVIQGLHNNVSATYSLKLCTWDTNFMSKVHNYRTYNLQPEIKCENLEI